MQSGIIFGTAAMIDGIIDRIAADLGEMPTLLATGGLARNDCKTLQSFHYLR